MKTILRKLTQPGINKDLSTYDAKRVYIFNYCNLFGLLASLVRLIYISATSVNHYTYLTIFANVLPLALCLTMAVFMHYRKYKTATYLSFLCFPPVLFVMYAATLDNSVSFFMILYFIFPFFFLNRKQNIIAAFSIAVACFLLVQLASALHLLFYSRAAYTFDTPLTYIDSMFSLVFIFSALYSIKFLVWSYEKSIRHKKEELKKLNHFKDKMFSIISHDLRSPFAATSQLIDLLKTVPMEQEEFTGYLAELKGQVDNARELMDNMLVWARRQMENEQVIADNTHISEVVNESFLVLNNQAVNKNIQLISEVDPAYLAYVDKDMIRVVIRNLVSNAIKFTKEGGHVKIKVFEANGDQLVLEVEDNGVGIAEDKQPLVLGNEYFTSYGTANEKGSGLGLKICREFVEKNGGTLSFRSQQGVGTTFSITLPVPKMQLLTADALQKAKGFFPGAKYVS